MTQESFPEDNESLLQRMGTNRKMCLQVEITLIHYQYRT